MFQEYKEYMVGLARAKLVQRQLKSTGLWKGMHVNLNSHSSRGLLGGGPLIPITSNSHSSRGLLGGLPSFALPPEALLFKLVGVPGYQLM